MQNKFWRVATRLRAVHPLYLSLITGAALAENSPALVCDQASSQVAAETEVPLDVLRAITRVETGRTTQQQLQPWPWTVNMQGSGIWFDTEGEAQVFVFRHFKAGARSFDVGCFQINYRWHGHAFQSLEQMFDPIENARYAGRYLSELHEKYGSWEKAVGAYHSRTHKFAQRYLSRFSKIRASLTPVVTATFQIAQENVESREQGPVSGSLVPLGQGQGLGFFHPGMGG